jgi:DNA-cytosine methyltransferase
MWIQLQEARSEEAKRIRRQTKDRDFSPRRGKILQLRKDGLANTLGTSLTKDNLIAWVTPKSTNTLSKSMKNISNTKTMMTSQKSTQQNYPTLTSLLGAFRAKLFQSPESEEALTILEELYSSTSPTQILKAKQPGLLLLENVKGLLSHDQGRTFTTIISTLDELGYGLQWQVLNSKNFGVPQNRERVFIVGHLRGTARPKVFPIGEGNQENIVLPTITTRITADSNGTYVGKRQTQEINQLNNPAHSNNRIYGAKGISPSLNTMQGGNRQPKMRIENKSREAFYHDKEAGTVRANASRNYQTVLEDMKIRRLTPTECERLQSFPDGWTEGVSDTQRYKCLGNTVTVNVVREIIKRLIARS